MFFSLLNGFNRKVHRKRNKTSASAACRITAYSGIILMLFFCLADVRPVSAGSGGDSVFRFLQLTGSARTAGLGGSHVALSNPDAALFLVNPAYLSSDSHTNLSLTWLNHISDINMGVASGAYHVESLGTFGAGVRFINYGSISRADESGTESGTFAANDMALTLGFAREVAPNLRAGLSGSAIHAGYDNYSSTAFSFDAGLYYFWEELNLHVGGAITNIGFQVSTFDGREESLPLDIRVGLSRRLEHVPLRLNLTFHSLNQWEIKTFRDEGESPSFSSNLFRHITAGGELLLSDNFHVHVGYDHLTNEELKVGTRLDTAGFGIGLGINIRGFQFDFSRSSFSDLGGVTRIGIQTYL